MTARAAVRSPLTYLGGLVVVYLALPLVAFAVRFVTTPSRGFHEAGLFPALWVSVSCATIALAIATVVGVPLAFVLARSTGRVAAVVGVIVQIPLALPPVISGIILIYLVGPYTTLGSLFHQELTESKAGIVIAMTFVAAPFLIVSARSAFAALDGGLLDVAGTLGHGEVSRFLRVAVPLAGGGIRAGMLLTWLRAFGEYGAVVILAYNPSSLPVYTYNQFSGAGLPTTLAPTALAIGVAVVAVGLSRVRVTRRRPRRTPAATPTPPATMPAEPFRFDVHHAIGSFTLALRLDAPTRQLAVLGPSGAGKSALLRTLAGLNGPRAGDLWRATNDEPPTRIDPRAVGYLAQGFSLFPHFTVWQQLLFARRATASSAAHWIDALGLAGLEDRFPHQISGGQRQRVALAQALCNEPHVLLLDEPFSALDVPVRHELRRVLRRLQREAGVTTVLVTHDPEEAAFLAETMMVVTDGHALQTGSVREVFSRPASPSVARLLGVANLADGVVAREGVISTHGLEIAGATTDLGIGRAVAWNIRPDDVLLVAPAVAGPADATRLSARVEDVIELGTALEIVVRLADALTVRVRASHPLEFREGDDCAVVLPAAKVAIWAATTSSSRPVVD